MTDKETKKGGRPPRSKDEGLLSRSLTFRVRPALYERVQSAAAEQQRSLSEEIEARLLHTFEREDIGRQRFGDPSVVFLANMIASAAGIIQLKTGKTFVEDLETREAVKGAVVEMLDTVTDVFAGVEDVSKMQRRFDRLQLQRLVDEVIDTAGHASIDLGEIMKR